MTTSDNAAAEPDERRSLVSRRTFIRGALLSAAAVPLASCTSNGDGNGAATTQPFTSTSAPAAVATPAVSPTATETWIEPWVWRVGDWPGQQLHLNVVENENPGRVIGAGDPAGVLFSYGGQTPGPTIRVRGNEDILVKLRNMLGPDGGITYVGPYPDPGPNNAELKALNLTLDEVQDKSADLGNRRHDFCLGEHTNGVHSARVTNLHTHGLHVRPGRNTDGTHSDNVIFRLINQEDLSMRRTRADRSECEWIRDFPDQTNFLRDDEEPGSADYVFKIGDVEARRSEAEDLPPQPHPPGTHWYHPHSHGATHNQVASGMAGFLVVEGDVDDAINRFMTRTPELPEGDPRADAELKTGPFDYRERMMLIQRVFRTPADPDAPTATLKQPNNPTPAVNGSSTPTIITMRPGAVERWRVLNGSVDGRGFKRFMVVEGQYDTVPLVDDNQKAQQLVKVDSSGNRRPATRAEIHRAKQQLFQLAMDGVTLIDSAGTKYTIHDLARRGSTEPNPLDGPIPGPGQPGQNLAMLRNYEACFASEANIRRCYVQPNEVYMGPANRCDVLFVAPRKDTATIYTVLGRAVVVHADNYQVKLQGAVAKEESTGDVQPLLVGPEDVIVAYVVVPGAADEQNPIPDFDVDELTRRLPDVPHYLRPVEEDELRDEASGSYRTRITAYSGWGVADFPLITTDDGDPSGAAFNAFVTQDDMKLEKLRYTRKDETSPFVLMGPNIRTMAISNTSDKEPDPTKIVGRKFDPNDPERPRMLLDTAEEWALYNYSTMLWGDTDTTKFPQPGQYNGHYVSYPISRGLGQDLFHGIASEFTNHAGRQFRIVTKGVDHPFHIHQNPFWVLRIEVPDQDGNLVNILEAPRWQDVIWIPRHRGRVIFRARFPDYVGTFVNHCHILLHEDNGMMQVVEVTPFTEDANYVPAESAGLDPDELDERYPRLDPEDAYRQSAQFVDRNHSTGQTFPGFEVTAPTLT